MQKLFIVHCMQNYVMIQHLSWTVGSKKPRNLLLIHSLYGKKSKLKIIFFIDSEGNWQNPKLGEQVHLWELYFGSYEPQHSRQSGCLVILCFGGPGFNSTTSVLPFRFWICMLNDQGRRTPKGVVQSASKGLNNKIELN